MINPSGAAASQKLQAASLELIRVNAAMPLTCSLPPVAYCWFSCSLNISLNSMLDR